MVTNSNLHNSTIKGIIDNGFALSAEDLAGTLNAEKKQLSKGCMNYRTIAEYVFIPMTRKYR